MNSSTNIQALVTRQAQAWQTGDIKTIIQDFDPNAVFIAAGFTFQGIEAIQQTVSEYFNQFNVVEVKIKRIIAANSQGAAEWDWQEENKKTGKKSQAEDAIIFELGDNGKILYWREYIEKKNQ